MSMLLFSHTPGVTIFDNRGLTVRDIAYHRHPDTPDVTGERTTRHGYDVRGLLVQSADPRLHEKRRFNVSQLTDLTGNVLCLQGVDNGATVTLNDAADRPFIHVSPENVTRTWQYEDAERAGRLLTITEQWAAEKAHISERFVYAGNNDAEKALNLAGQLVRHYDTAGMVQTNSIALTGVPLSVTRRLVKNADNPDVVADWQGQDTSALNDLLDGETWIAMTTTDATGAILTNTDAKGNQQRMAYDAAGLLSGSWLTLKGSTEKAVVKSLTYSAAGQKLREEHGNGVVTTYTYEAETRRLIGIKTERPAGHASGAKVLQDLRYDYDPVGNVLSIRNDAEETRFWRNQKVVPENTCTYDSLYQLVSATGREMANISQQSSKSPSATIPLPTDSSAYTCYTRTYTYDTGGNLTQIRHSAPASGNSYTTNITVSDRSNRGVLSTLTANPSDVDALFTSGGQQKQLQPGQSLSWTSRSELLKVSPVLREGDRDDRESYRYDGGSQRILKVSMQKTSGSMQIQRVLYLPGLELRTTASGSTETESLQVITVGEAGRAQVRAQHWEGGRPAGVDNNQLRYSYDNLSGSSQLELDEHGNIISMEEYYPYGGTAVWAARSQTEAAYKIIRYSGKERDATGLYYYGYRYYQPWAGRWLSADPAGTVDGLNLFRMVSNNPVTLADRAGLMGVKLIYGMETVRHDYLKDKRVEERLLKIDDINAALGITHLALPDIAHNIKKGIKVTQDNVNKLCSLSGFLSDVEAKDILKGWSSFLKKNYSSLSMTKMMKKEKANGTLYNTMIKNNFDGDMFLSRGNLTFYASNHVNVLSKEFRSKGGRRGYKLLKESFSGENTTRAKSEVAASLMNSFFRKTSKLGLDWAYSRKSPVTGVDFLVWSERGEFSEADINKKNWLDIKNIDGHEGFSPITFSELRHANRKNYPVNKIKKLALSTRLSSDV